MKQCDEDLASLSRAESLPAPIYYLKKDIISIVMKTTLAAFTRDLATLPGTVFVVHMTLETLLD